MGISTALYFDATSLLYEMLPDDQTTCFKCADGANKNTDFVLLVTEINMFI